MSSPSPRKRRGKVTSTPTKKRCLKQLNMSESPVESDLLPSESSSGNTSRSTAGQEDSVSLLVDGTVSTLDLGPSMNTEEALQVSDSSGLSEGSTPTLSDILQAEENVIERMGVLTMSPEPQEASDIEEDITATNLYQTVYESNDFEFEYKELFRKYKRKTKGALWKQFKPANENSLFYKVISNPPKTNDIVRELIESCNNDPALILKQIVRFFADIAGCQKFKTDNIFKYDAAIYRKIASLLNDSRNYDHNHYIFEKKTAEAEYLQAGICCFFYNFIQECNKLKNKMDILFHFYYLIEAMLNPTITFIPVKKSATVIAFKMITVFISLIQKSRSDSEEKVFISFRSNLFTMISEACILPDLKLWIYVNVELAKEMFHWINLWPEYITKREQKFLAVLKKLLELAHTDGVIAGLNLCEKLLATDKFLEELRPIMKAITKLVVDCIGNPEQEIVNRALKILTVQQKYYSGYIIEEYYQEIIDVLFYKQSKLGKSAANFLYVLFKKQCKTDVEIVHTVCIYTKKYPELLPTLVDSCIDYPELKNWVLLFGLLFDDNFEDSLRMRLAAIILESMIYVLTGSTSLPRDGVTANPSDQKQKEKIAHFIITYFDRLLEAFVSTKEMFIKLLTVLIALLNSDLGQRFDSDFERAINVLQRNYNVCKDKDIMMKIVQVLWVFQSKTQTRNSLIVQYVSYLNETKNNLPSMEELDKFLLKLSVIFTEFNLSAEVDWDYLFQFLELDIRFTKHAMPCCQWYLIWQIREQVKKFGTQDSDLPNRVGLEKYLKNFVNSCVNVIKTTKGSPIIIAYETLMGLIYYISCETEKRFKDFEHLRVKLSNEQTDEIVKKVFPFFFDRKSALPLRERRLFVSSFVDSLNVGGIPFCYFSTIFRYYESHFDQFGVIIETTMVDMKRMNPALILAIKDTLIDLYDEILEQHGTVNIESDQFKSLKKLAKKFSSFKDIDSQKTRKLVLGVVGFVLKHENDKYFNFLQLMTYFVPNLTPNHKKEIHSQFIKLVPNKYAKVDVLNRFAILLKSKK